MLAEKFRSSYIGQEAKALNTRCHGFEPYQKFGFSYLKTIDKTNEDSYLKCSLTHCHI